MLQKSLYTSSKGLRILRLTGASFAGETNKKLFYNDLSHIISTLSPLHFCASNSLVQGALVQLETRRRLQCYDSGTIFHIIDQNIFTEIISSL